MPPPPPESSRRSSTLSLSRLSCHRIAVPPRHIDTGSANITPRGRESYVTGARRWLRELNALRRSRTAILSVDRGQHREQQRTGAVGSSAEQRALDATLVKPARQPAG